MYNPTLLEKEIFHPERFRGNEGFALADITVSQEIIVAYCITLNIEQRAAGDEGIFTR